MAMGGAAREFVLRIVADITDATKGIEKVGDVAGGMKQGFKGVGNTITNTVLGQSAAIMDFGQKSIQAATDAQKSMRGVQTVFGDSADEVEAFSNKAIKSMGISDDAYQSFATTTGSILKDMGVPLDQTVTMTDELAQRGADLAAVYGVDADKAMSTLTKAMAGSYKGMKELGVQIDDQQVETYALSKGWVDAEGNVTRTGKAMARQALIMEKTSDKAGAFKDQSGDLANQQKILQLQYEETQETIGSALLPVMQQLLGIMQPLMDFTAKYANIIIPIAGVIAAIVVATKAYSTAEAAATTVKTVATGVQWAFNAAMAANPIGLIVIAIIAVIAAVILLYKKVDWFRDFVDKAIDLVVAAWNWLLDVVMGVFNWVKEHWPLLLAIITGPIGLAVYTIVKYWDQIKAGVAALFDAIKWYYGLMFDIITWPFKKGAEIVTNVWQGVLDFFWKIPQTIGYFFSNIADIIKKPFEAAFDAIKWFWNNTVGGFGFSVPSWVPGVGGKDFRIPKMATGGIVTRPTIALIGEAGPEAVVPLGSHGFGNVTINVYALTANAEVGRRVYEALQEYGRTSGKAIA